jgi:16S rRNA (uracil1498-N3)-methyltransferase
MHRHHVTPGQIGQSPLVLGRIEARHLQTVLRVRQGDAIELFDGRGRTVAARIAACDRHGLTLEHTAAPVAHPAPACRLTLAPCVSKGRRMDWTLEKAAELGAGCIMPILSERSVIQLDTPGEADDKQARWQRIVVEATRQCGGAWVPEVMAPLPFDQALPRLRAIRPLLAAALTPDARPLREILADLAAATPPREAAWIVGPEGDFTPGEIERLREASARLCSLGAHVLRTETAAVYGLAVLGAAWL